MKKKLFSLFMILVMIPLLLTGCGKSTDKKEETNLNKINIVIVDENKKELFNKEIETNKKYLNEVLKETEEIKLKSEKSDYGDYITSMMGIDQKNTDKGMYYWSYYINDEYAQVGISSYEIKNGDTYKFVYEYYES